MNRAMRVARCHCSNCLLRIGSGTWKIPSFSQALGLRKFWASPHVLELGRILHISSYSWDLKQFRFLPLYTGSRTWKNSKLPPPSNTICWRSTERSEARGVPLFFPMSPLYKPWDFKKFRTSSWTLGHGKIPIARCKLSLFCPLHIGSGTWKNSKLPPRFRNWENSGLSCSLKQRHETWSIFFGSANKFLLRQLVLCLWCNKNVVAKVCRLLFNIKLASF